MIILASKSPRRKELMGKEITHDFLIKTYDIDEEASYVFSPLEAVKDIARRKGEIAHKHDPDSIVIAADTIVVLENEIIGKPKDEEDAFRILKKLSNKTHEVITAYSIFYKDFYLLNYVTSKVTFNCLSDDFINSYIATKSPMDKAGAYGVQDNDKFPIVKSINGSIKNVVGFPTDEIKKDLIENGLL